MKNPRLPALLLGLLYAGFLIYLTTSAGQLPDRVATHFDATGQPNGWMSRSGHVQFTLILGLVVPLVFVGALFIVRFLPESAINIPRRDYWLAPERRGEVFAYLFRQSLWIASFSVCFITGVHALIVRANAHSPAHLSTAAVLGLAAAFLIVLAAWAVITIRHFRQR